MGDQPAYIYLVMMQEGAAVEAVSASLSRDHANVLRDGYHRELPHYGWGVCGVPLVPADDPPQGGA
jgi:hypothetical protein